MGQMHENPPFSCLATPVSQSSLEDSYGHKLPFTRARPRGPTVASFLNNDEQDGLVSRKTLETQEFLN